MFGPVGKMTPKRPLMESKRTLFLEKQHILTQLRFTRIAFSLKKQPFLRVSLVAHVYNNIIRAPPPPPTGLYQTCRMRIKNLVELFSYTLQYHNTGAGTNKGPNTPQIVVAVGRLKGDGAPQK